MDTWQPDPPAAAQFYGALFGWDFDAPIRMSGFSGEYYLARLDGRLVAGVGQAPPRSPAGWLTHVRVDDVGKALAHAEQAGGRGLAEYRASTRAALIADSSGVMFCLREAGEDHRVELVDQPNSWAMSSLHTPDLEKAQEFYRTMFDWELESSPEGTFSRWVRDDRIVAVATTTDGTDIPAHWSINFSVGSADEIAERAVDLGADSCCHPRIPRDSGAR
ncbi:VOC family protein [Arthrobacter agilis]|uniref:VOC family protein n=1 Tax=Arthrobacter agilis TaxID=37921 RepID=UPI0027D870EB|nr:VOC family protein [Arthrobacter agilis]